MTCNSLSGESLSTEWAGTYQKIESRNRLTLTLIQKISINNEKDKPHWWALNKKL
jgi:hypothetical protein